MRCWITSLVAFVLAAAAAGLLAIGADAAAVVNCGSLTVGPTALPTGKTGGAVCLLHAYQQHCRPSVYELSRFGVDTIARDDFRVVSTNGRCRINVTNSFIVVPQKPHLVGSGGCSSLIAFGTDVIARGCIGSGLQSAYSLTGRR